MKSLLLLGSTGSIGTQTLDVVRRAPRAFRVEALVAAGSWEPLLDQVREFRPARVGLVDASAADRLRPHLPDGTSLVVGAEVAEELAVEADYDLCMQGMVGAAGVQPSQRVLERGKDLALANKESLVVAGGALMETARRTGASVVPVDSEHSAIFQCLRGEAIDRVRKIYLTASGGPFRDMPLKGLANVSPKQALAHPNWDMGPRVSIGSATLMNKALEVIETHHLFGLDTDRIEVLVHRQSVVHSMVEFVDGSIIAQLGPPDMRGPIHFALHGPDRAPSELKGFDPALFRELTFEPVDHERFPALELGFRCVEAGGDAGAVLNAADEVAVEAFLAGEIPFQEIVRIDRSVLEMRSGQDESIAALLRADTWARERAREAIEAVLDPALDSARPGS